MINIDSATQSAKILLTAGATNITNLPMIAQKGNWKTQITGVYDLIFPDLHIDFPTREDMLKTLTDAFNLHNITNMHFGEKSSPGVNTPCYIALKPKEKIVGKVKVRAGSIINGIGYGV